MKRTKPFIFLGLLLVALSAQAQTVQVSAKITWTTPTQALVDNSPLTGVSALTGILAFVSTSPIPEGVTKNIELPPTATSWTYQGQHAVGSTLYVRLKVRNAAGLSAYSPETRVVIQGVAPKVSQAPGAPTVTVVIVQ